MNNTNFTCFSLKPEDKRKSRDDDQKSKERSSRRSEDRRGHRVNTKVHVMFTSMYCRHASLNIDHTHVADLQKL